MSPAAPPSDRERDALERLSRALAAEIDIRLALPVAAAMVREILPHDDAALLVLDEAEGVLRPLAATRDIAALTNFRVDLPNPDSASVLSLSRGETVVVDDTAEDRFAFDRQLLEHGIRSHLAHPLRRSARLLGTLNLASRSPGAFRGVPRGFLDSVASTLALAVHNHLLFDRLRASESQYASLVEGTRDFIYRLDGEGRFRFANLAGARLLGIERERILGQPWLALFGGDPPGADPLLPLIRGEREQLEIEVEGASRQGGSPIPTRHRLHALRDAAGTLVGLQGLAHDTTSERAARRARRLHRDLVEALDDFVFMAARGGRLLALNRKAREALGFSEEETGAMSIEDLYAPEAHPRVEAARRELLERHAATLEADLRTRGGRAIPTRGRLSYSPESGTLQGVLRDLTDERLQAERMLHVERLRALGELASGVAHTFNNLLAVIGTTVQVTRRLVKDEEVLRELSTIERTVYDGGAAVRRIQDFTRMRPPEPYHEVRLDRLLHEMAEATRVEIRAARRAPVEVREPEMGPLRVTGSEAELRDVFRSLISNALDAMPDGGTLELGCAATEDAVEVLVRDTGRGMTPEVRERIFMPFFSTKGERGSGLGLALAANIVSQHGGTITVETQPLRGSSFRVRLPRLPPPGPAAAPARVVLVIADPWLRSQVEGVLIHQGHQVAGTTEEPGAACAFLDLGWLERAGLGELERLAEAGTRVVLIAGWADSFSEGELRSRGLHAVLRSPFPPEAVLRFLGRPRRSGAP